ncbi:MAG: PLP-dependent aminotransferase family protein [Hamadaea sp.]|uniref:MocR-like pyridoxine biosynthesis transcription factor PdxR n=1 Tax=Hamadaea sp. TaxID=2024425 RepID=UPI0017BE5B2C|nr:PLP-dependent aminotransferase family protein [Hamadaea sp.]NUR69474.1 PLP-dependent aminotransferase family protein [Hamadaea sp.]NUT20710.1 PLP-dependent aminotransferase family protein [Hamadaea sp.]
MPIEWTGSGPELLLNVDRNRPEPLRDQLERALRESIRAGRLSTGERLPSSRALARDLGISRGLVTECYAQLQAEGYLVTQGGSATRVAATAQVSSVGLPPSPPTEPVRIDFRPGIPDLSSFPREQWSRALRRACREAPSDLLGSLDPYGDPTLREVLAAYLRRVRGAAADPGHTVVCAGYAQGLHLVLRALMDGGVRTVAFEDPGDPDQRAIAEMLGLGVVGVPVDEGGVDVEALAATDARAVVLTPTHQSPTGVLLAPDRRQALIAWATTRNATVIEDDYDAEFRYDRAPVGALQGLAPHQVALVGSVSKSLAPALRLGWILSPPHLAAAVAHYKQLLDRGSPVIDQLALADLLESGHYDRHLRHMRQRYAARRTALVEAMRRYAPDVELSGLAAGFHTVARLPTGTGEAADPAEQAVIAAGRQRSVGLYGMSAYLFGSRRGPAQLVLGFGNLTPAAIAEGVETVADLLQPR